VRLFSLAVLFAFLAIRMWSFTIED